jgi:acetyl esterase/lipase
MKFIVPITLALIGLALPTSTRPVPAPQVVELWPGKVPGDVGIPGEEQFIDLKVRGKEHLVAGKPTRWMTNVTRPSITLYPAPKDKDRGVSMLICPGGGYHNLGWDIEGEEIAAWLNSIGISGILLKYRCPRRPGDEKGVPPAGPLIDAQRAVRLVRSRAKEWGLDPKRIGIVGFSAGGHLAAATATNYERRTYEPVDEADQLSCRPDFAVPVYSGYFKVKDGLSPTIVEAAGAPPLLIIHATDDAVSDVEHSVTLYLAMKRAGVPVEMHLYAAGGHGFGVRKVGLPCESWTERCVDWMRSQGILK